MWELEADTVKDLLEIQKKLLSSIIAKRCNFRLNISTNLSYPINGYSYSPNRFAFTTNASVNTDVTLSNGFTFTKTNVKNNLNDQMASHLLKLI